MKVLLDTNVLMRVTDQNDERHDQALAAIDAIDQLGHEPVLVPQTLYEFWTAATRRQNGLNMSATDAGAYVDDYCDIFTVIDDTPDVFRQWLRLVREHSVRGTNAYDGRLAGAMFAHGIRHLLTFNARDFRKYGLVIVDPMAPEEALQR